MQVRSEAVVLFAITVQAQSAPSSSALPAIACGGAVAAAAVASQRTGLARCHSTFLTCPFFAQGRQSRTSILPTSVVEVKDSQTLTSMQTIMGNDMYTITISIYKCFHQQSSCLVWIQAVLCQESSVTRRALDQSSRYADLSLDEDTLIRT